MATYQNADTCAVRLPELTLGDRGSIVGLVQVLLTIKGYHIREHFAGVFEAETKRAVEDYQRDIGLTVTGTVNTPTWGWLLKMGG